MTARWIRVDLETGDVTTFASAPDGQGEGGDWNERAAAFLDALDPKVVEQAALRHTTVAEPMGRAFLSALAHCLRTGEL